MRMYIYVIFYLLKVLNVFFICFFVVFLIKYEMKICSKKIKIFMWVYLENLINIFYIKFLIEFKEY